MTSTGVFVDAHLHQQTSTTNVVFDVKHFQAIADLMQHRKRRVTVLTEERRQKLVEAGRRFRFETGLQASS